MVYIPEEKLNCSSNTDDNTSTDDTTTSDDTVTQENRSPLVLPSGCLSSTVLKLSCKGIQERKYYSFDLSNRMISGDTISKVEVYPNDDTVTGTQATYDKQTFKVLLSGGEGITNVGILFIITTLSGEVLEFTCVLPIRPEGVLQVGLDANYVMGGQGPSGKGSLSLDIGTVDTLDPNEKATADIIHGSDGKDTINFAIPQGAPGVNGKDGANGTNGKDGTSYVNDGTVDLDVKSATIGGYSPVLNIPFIERDITLTYTQTTATGKQYYVPKFQDNLFGKTVSQIGVMTNKDNGTLTISLIDRPDISTNKLNVIKQTVLTTQKSQYWYDLNWDIGENQSIAVCNTTDTAGITYTDASDTNREMFLAWMGSNWNDYAYVGSIKAADLNVGFKVKETQTKEILSDKKIVILGDSISSFKNFCVLQSNYQSYPKGTITQYNQTWMSKFIQKAGGNLIYNDSRGSSGVTTNGVAANSLTARTNIPSYTDVCLVFMGINDFNGGSIAKLGDFDPTKTTFDNSIFSDAMCTSILALQAAAPKCKLIWVTPLRRFNSDGTPSLSSENISLNTWTDRIIEICNYYGVETVDMRGVGINGSNQTLYFADGVHPGNEECTQLIANYLYKNLNNLF